MKNDKNLLYFASFIVGPGISGAYIVLVSFYCSPDTLSMKKNLNGFHFAEARRNVNLATNLYAERFPQVNAPNANFI